MVDFIEIPQYFQELHVIGDMHGDFRAIYNGILNKHKHFSCIFQVGDFMSKYAYFSDSKMKAYEESLRKLNDDLVNKNSYLFIVRGNHDMPGWFTGNFRYSNIFFIKDWSVLSVEINFERKNIFCIGGAISVDRIELKMDGFYFEGEGISFIDNFEAFNIDYLITHTAPDYAKPGFNFPQFIYDFAKQDDTLIEELIEERTKLGAVVNKIIDDNPGLKQYFYGHFHNKLIGEHRGVKLRCLEVDEVCEIL